MKSLQKWVAIFGLIHLLNHIGLSQDYLWPTDASHYLTSSFAEYRPGHFHAGIDIKTWSKIGYQVFAIRDGYLVRIGVSPYGYGKVIYQKLDSGEIAVYAHLDRFNDELQNYIKQEQRKKGAYRINNYLERYQFPIKKGDLIGYTGASGIGSPHLHFEIRDANNNPINPFLLGYRVEDTIPPKVTAISITPLDCYSRVNADVTPFIEKPTMMNDGNYKLSSKPIVSGNIGFAIDCFDQADGVNNIFAAYKLDFYVDGTLYFVAQYDKFSYSVSSLIDLDRDFRLISQGKGRFQKLYKEKFNQLPFYKPNGDEIGVIRCDPNMENDNLIQNFLGKGEHQFIIHLYDFFGNLATVTGSFLVAERKMIYADFQSEKPDQFFISDIHDQDGNNIERPEIFISTNQGISWQKKEIQLVKSDSATNPILIEKYLLKPVKPQTIVKIQSVDDYGIESFPSYYLANVDTLANQLINELNLKPDFYDDYIRFTLLADGLIQSFPKLYVQQIGMPPTEVSLWQNRFNEFIGIYQLLPGKDGLVSIEAKAIDLSDRELTFWQQFDVRTVSPDRGGSIASSDGRCRVKFYPESVYKNLYLRIKNFGPLDDSTYDFVAEGYEIFPQDIPFKRSATIELKYPSSDSLPDKLGIYQAMLKKPAFRGNKIDIQKKTISCNISNLGVFILIRDTIPPNIEIQYPEYNSQLRDKKPNLLAVVYDELSGIANENAIVMHLDGEKVIAEFDPDAKTVKFEPDEPLLPGEHTVSVFAVDNSQNEARVKHKFFILE